MTNYRQDGEVLLEQLTRHTESATAMGGADKRSRQRERRRLNARERIPSFCDEGTFYEYGALAGGKHPGGREPLPGDDLVGGTARISGRYLVIIAEDFTVKGGSIGHPNAAKRTQIKGSENLKISKFTSLSV